jgi:hypothetical protein
MQFDVKEYKNAGRPILQHEFRLLFVPERILNRNFVYKILKIGSGYGLHWRCTYYSQVCCFHGSMFRAFPYSF